MQAADIARGKRCQLLVYKSEGRGGGVLYQLGVYQLDSIFGLCALLPVNPFEPNLAQLTLFSPFPGE